MWKRESARYWLADKVRGERRESGWRPDFPPKTGFCLLADTRHARWGIDRAELTLRRAAGRRAKPIEGELESLLDSATRYPPALAIARDDMSRAFKDAAPKREPFLKAYADALRRRLAEQRQSPYVLAESLREDLGYLSPGDWYWVLRVEGADVFYVSDDWHIYRAPLAHFALPPESIERLTRRPA